MEKIHEEEDRLLMEKYGKEVVKTRQEKRAELLWELSLTPKFKGYRGLMA